MVLAQTELIVAGMISYVKTFVMREEVHGLAGFVSWMFPETSVGDAISALDQLCFDPRRSMPVENKDHSLLPVFRISGGESVLIPLATVLWNRPERVLLRLAGQDPASMGSIAKRIDEAHSLAKTIQGQVREEVLCATEVGFVDENGKPGDYDVVIVAPETGVGLIVEVGSSIRPASGPEFHQLASKLADKIKRQIPRGRRSIESGVAQVAWPAIWPKLSSIEWHWGISALDFAGLMAHKTTGVLIRDCDVFEVSRDHVRYVGCQDTLADLIKELRHPKVPPYKVVSNAVSFGDTVVVIERAVPES